MIEGLKKALEAIDEELEAPLQCDKDGLECARFIILNLIKKTHSTMIEKIHSTAKSPKI